LKLLSLEMMLAAAPPPPMSNAQSDLIFYLAGQPQKKHQQ